VILILVVGPGEVTAPADASGNAYKIGPDFIHEPIAEGPWLFRSTISYYIQQYNLPTASMVGDGDDDIVLDPEDVRTSSHDLFNGWLLFKKSYTRRGVPEGGRGFHDRLEDWRSSLDRRGV
jgi:hypothetical protein